MIRFEPTLGPHTDPLERLIWEPMLRKTTVHYPIARRDPVFTPLFTAILGGGGFAIGATTTITYASIASAIAVTALTVGLQMALAPKPPKPEDGKAPMTQAIPHRIWAVGRTRLAGARMLWEAIGPQLYSVTALTGHLIKSINRYFLHDDEVQITDYGGRTGGVQPVGGRYSAGGVRLFSRLGLSTETPYAELIADIGQQTGDPGQTIWTTNHRGDGQASLAMIAQNASAKSQSKSYPYGPPSPSVELDGAYCWDVRDPLQDPEDPATWSWTQNSALLIAWQLCFNEFGFRLDYRKALLPVIEMWQEEADICDELVPLAGGGFERRYECNGWDTTENSPKAGLNAMLATCDGHLVNRGDGARILTVGKFRESRCATLRDADILGHRIDHDVLFEDEINRLIPQFTYPETDYTTSDTDYFEDTTAQLSAGRVLAEVCNLQWVHQWRQARRCALREWKRILQKVKGQIDVRLSGINAVYARWVILDTPLSIPRLNGKVVENRRSIIAITKGGFTMDVSLHPTDIDVWDPDADEGQQPPVPVVPAPGELVVPVINLVQARSSAGSVYIRVVVIDPEDSSLTPTVHYRLTDADGLGTPGPWIEQRNEDAVPAGGYLDLATGVVPADKALQVEAAFIAADGQYSGWSITQDIISTLDPVAPGTPLSLTAPNSVTTVPVSAKAANDNTTALIFKRGTTAQSFAAATQIGRFAVSANQTISFNDTPGVGTWKYWCGAENISGVPSAAQASTTTVVT